MDTDSFIIRIKTEDVYKDIADDVEKRFDTSNYKLTDHCLQKKKEIGLMKDELGRKIMRICCTLTKSVFLLNGWWS